MSEFTIRSARADDQTGIERLLIDTHLPSEGIAPLLHGFLVAESGRDIVGVVGLEPCGEYALLRSTAVASDWRGKGVGKQLVERAVAHAESQGIRALYLLTTTAEHYFPSFGFQVTTRDAVPATVQATDEFRGACPASATVMCRAVAAA
jgi:N-acetylglutamate synthase-like GNAT family acetyltransferase